MPEPNLPRAGLLDRVHECGELERLVAGVRAGESRVLVIRGEAGIGKTALLERLSAIAHDCRVARAAGVESEMELAFAGVHALCLPMLDRVGHLPGPQRDALNTAFGLTAGTPPDRFLVGLAVLSLLADAAEERPLLCIVDDAQWLDRVSAQTLAFVARRLLAERVGLVFALRDSREERELDGLPKLQVEGLPAPDARRLLDATIPVALDARIRDRILGEAGGNPLALLELPRGRQPIPVAGGFGLPGEPPLTSRIEQGFVRQLEAFGADSRQLLLLAAAEPVGDVMLLRRAAEQLGIGAAAAEPVEAEGLVKIGAHVRFRHPLVRSAAYRSASAAERRAVHRALADATDEQLDPDRRAWHRACAAEAPDDAVADELERSADRAQSRGGLSAAAAFLQRAAELTQEPGLRVRRSVAAAQAKLEVADLRAASDLLAAAELGPLDELQRARIERLSAQIAFSGRRGRDAPPLLYAAARRLEGLDPAMARETYLEAMASAMFAGRLGIGPDTREVAEAAHASSRPQSTGPADLLLDALVVRFTEGYPPAVEPLVRALRAFDGSGCDAADQRWLWLACRLAQDIWDDELWCLLATRGVRVARETGALNLLPNALNYLAAFNVLAGAANRAAALIEELDSVVQATALPPLKYAAALLAATRGDEARDFMDWGWRNLTERGEGSGLGAWLGFSALRANGRALYDEAFASARQACEYDDVMVYGWALAELVESGVRSGHRDEAGAALEQLTARTQASGTDWGLGVEARCGALVHDDESLYQESIARLARSRAALDLARARLVYGEWLRRESRRVDAREQLRAAHDTFAQMGAEGFAERARRELAATGETVRRRTVETAASLTTQEEQVARLAAEGHTNPEIGARLFISPRTVEYHLHKVFAKLGINSRRELHAALPLERAAAPA
ncbi:MAG TPA: LuxR C-terminal-related transcriptional regulator [Gaiellaceae bacterium]|nr:LuxR C-terminal-related transcriptional regulator [Gaiellaceae bacterium]